MRVVVDTNVVVSGIFWGGNPRKILDHWVHDAFNMVVSSPVLDEYVRVVMLIGRKQPELTKEWVDFLSSNVVIAEVNLSLDICRDKHDNKFLECAVSAGVDCIVSGDDDLLSLRDVYGIPILTPARFLSEIEP